MVKCTHFVFAVMLVISVKGTAQEELDEILVVADRLTHVAGSNDLRVDSVSLVYTAARDVGTALQSQSGVYMRSYGPGLATTISFRGFNASQTAVYWNGIPISSPALGLTDMSTVPLSEGDALYFDEGSGSVLFGSAYMGGGVHIQSHFSDAGKVHLQHESRYSTIGLYQNRTTAEWNPGRTSHRISLNWRKGEQNFRYIDLYGEERRRIGTDIDSRDLQYIGQWKLDRHTFKWGGWGQDIDRGLPPSISEINIASARQYDQVFRGFAEWSTGGKQYSLLARTAYTFEDQRYTSILVNDTNLARARFSTVTGAWQFNNRWKATGLLEHTWQEVSGSAKNTGSVNRWGSALVVNGFLNEYWRLQTGLRMEYQGQWTPLLPNLSIAWTSGNYTAQWSYRHHYRFPTLNDMYWNPGGNPGLRPETGRTLSWDNLWKQTVDNTTWTAELGVYHALTEDYIQWLPTGTFFEPRNVKRVEHLGGETTLKWKCLLGSASIEASGSYAWSRVRTIESERVNDPSIGRQLIYTPLHGANLSFGGSCRRWSLWGDGRYTGEVHTTSDNNPRSRLDPFAVFDMGLSREFGNKGWGARLAFTVHNIGNTAYQQQRYYPMPGRNYSLQLTLEFEQ